MKERRKTPRYAIHLFFFIVSSGIIFFVGLQFFVPAGAKLTGSYDAESLLYIASAPLAYRGSDSCGTSSCHSPIFIKWSGGAHGARKEQSKCEVCHGPQGGHPDNASMLKKVTGDGDITKLCLSCHQKLKARSATGQPQISPQQHPYPHKEVLKCSKCHDPHSPEIDTQNSKSTPTNRNAGKLVESNKPTGISIGSECFSCHGPLGRGGFAPILAGQPFEVLRDKLIKFRSGELKGTMMNPIVSKMKDKEIETLAQYFAGLS